MGLADLNQLPRSEEQDDYHTGEVDDFDYADAVIYPSSAGAMVHIYFDDFRFRDDRAINTIIEDYRHRHSTIVFQPTLISRQDLHTRRYFAFPRTERGFVKDGYAAEFDLRQGDEGPVTTAYLSAQKSVLHVHASLLYRILNNVGPTFFGWADQFTENGARVADYSAKIRERSLSNLAPLFGEDSVKQGKLSTQFAMVDWQGLRLGADVLGPSDHAHLAFSGTPNSWLKGARATVGEGFFGWHQTDRLARQIDLELSEAGLRAFFGAQHWRHHGAPVSAGAVLTWQSQVIGCLRKLLWRAQAEESQLLLKNELMKERQALRDRGIRRNPVGSGRLPLGDPETAFRDIFAEQVDNFADRFAAEAAAEADKIPVENVSSSVDERDILIGALCGSGIDLRMPHEKPDPVHELAWWLAHLRQTGEGVIDGYFACLFEEVRGDPREELTDLLYAALSDKIWTALLDVANEVERTDQTFVVRYTWGSLDAPWTASRRDKDLNISGPLLYFPVTEAGKWTRLADLLASNDDFLAPRAIKT